MKGQEKAQHGHTTAHSEIDRQKHQQRVFKDVTESGEQATDAVDNEEESDRSLKHRRKHER